MTRTVTDEQLDDFLGYAQRAVNVSYGKFAKCFYPPYPSDEGLLYFS